jgi:dephospho-CoA kinase
MPAIAITGRIGSGKSEVLHILAPLLGVPKDHIYCADEENRKLLDHDAEVRDLITKLLGSACYTGEGRADRSKIFSLISSDPRLRRELENILHPRLEILWKPKAACYSMDTSAFFIAEIPLLYEKHLEEFFNQVIVVGCSESTKKERLHRYRSLDTGKAEAWSMMQGSLNDKIPKANYLIWNDGSHHLLQEQIRHLTSHLLSLNPLSF